MLMNWKPTFNIGDLKQDMENNFNSISNYLDFWNRKINSKNVTSLDTDRTSIKSNDGTTEIIGPLLEMKDSLSVLRIKMGLDRSDNVFKFLMYNAAGDTTISLDSLGNAVFSGELSIGTGNDICRITADGLWLGHATRTSSPFQVTKAGVMTLTGASSSLSVGTADTISKIDSNGIYSGNAVFASAPFKVTPAGVLTLTGASSSISVGSGNTIAKIDSNGIYCGHATFASAPFNVSPAGVLNLTGTSSSLSVGSGNTISKMDSNGIYCGNATFASAPFNVSPLGVLSLTGTSSLLSVGTGNTISKMDSNGIYCGHGTFASAPFRVDQSGNLTATSATITGAISGSTITGSSFSTLQTSDVNYIKISDDGFESYVLDTTYKKHGLNIETTGWADAVFYYTGSKYFKIATTIPGVQLMAYDSGGSAKEILSSYNGNTIASNTWDFSTATVTGLTTDSAGAHTHTVNVGGIDYVTDSQGSHSHSVS